MRKVLVTAATFKPFERDQVKTRPELRLASTTDDRVIDDLIESAVEAYEEYTNNILRQSTWDLYFDSFPDGDEFETPAPLVSVTSIKYKDTADVEKTFSASYYNVDTTNPISGRIALEYGECWESTYGNINDVVVRIVAGYASANAIPRRIKDGLLLKMQEIYYGTDLSAAYESCWANYRRFPI